jgi:hypothetical protein
MYHSFLSQNCIINSVALDVIKWKYFKFMLGCTTSNFSFVISLLALFKALYCSCPCETKERMGKSVIYERPPKMKWGNGEVGMREVEAQAGREKSRSDSLKYEILGISTVLRYRRVTACTLLTRQVGSRSLEGELH